MSDSSVVIDGRAVDPSELLGLDGPVMFTRDGAEIVVVVLPEQL
jgi:hypothetical protein